MTETREGIVLSIHATPRASKSQIQGLHGEALKIRLQAPPVDGKANDTLLEYLAKVLNVPRRQVILLSGQTSRQKRVSVKGITAAQAMLSFPSIP
jgi:uncharacterized protein (TIGR00251 family)